MADFNETDTNIAIGKIMKLIEELKDAKGNGDSLLSIIVPPRDDLSRVTRELVNKVFLPCHECAIRAITSAQQKLQLYSKVPPNGLVIYTGTVVTDDGSTKEVSIDFEPFEPMHTSSLCLLDNKFSMEGLSELLEYEENYVRENDKNVAIWKVKQLMKALQYAKGHGDSLISIFIKPGKEISQFTEMLDDRFGTASTSSINMSAIGAITSALQILKRYSKVPPNGLIVYTGTVVTDGKEEKDIKVEFEPFKPIDGSICQLHHRFHIETLYVMLKQPEYGFIVMADNKVLFGILSGNTKKVQHQFTVNYPSWRQIGGADHEYFRETYLRKVADWANMIYIDYSDFDVSAIVVAVSPTYQTDFIDRLDPRIRKKIMCMVEVSYAGNHGFDTAIDLSSNHLYNVRFIQEIWLLKKFMKEMNQETKKYVTGVEDTLKCLDLGAVKILIVWENLDINRYVLKNTTTVRSPSTSPILVKHKLNGPDEPSHKATLKNKQPPLFSPLSLHSLQKSPKLNPNFNKNFYKKMTPITIEDDVVVIEEKVIEEIDSEVEVEEDDGEDDGASDDGDDGEEDDDDDDDDDDVQEVFPGGAPVVTAEDDEEDEDEDGDEDDDGEDDGDDSDDDDDDDEEEDDEEDAPTEYLVRPIANPEEEEDASDFEPEENGADEDAESEEEDEDDEGDAGKVEAPPKRKRSGKDGSDDDDDDGGNDDERPSKR